MFYKLKLRLLDYSVRDLGRLGSFSSMDTCHLEHFKELIENSYGMTSRPNSRRMPETVENMRTAMESEKRPGNEVHASVFDSSVLTKRNCAEAGDGTLYVMGCAPFDTRFSRSRQSRSSSGI